MQPAAASTSNLDVDPGLRPIGDRYRIESTLGRGGMAVVYLVLAQTRINSRHVTELQ
jgi:hypothetical protein